MQKSGGSDNDDTSQITMENHPLQGEGNVVSLSEEGGEEEDKGVDQVRWGEGERVKR